MGYLKRIDDGKHRMQYDILPVNGVTIERYLHVYRSWDAEAAAAFGALVG